MGEVVKVNRAVQPFGLPLSNVVCKCCKQKMYYAGRVVKRYGDSAYEFEGYKCGFCGHEHVEHTNGGVLGHVKE